MKAAEKTTVRNAATLGMAAGAITTLVSGIGVAITLLRGVPRLLMAVFLAAIGLTVVSTLTYLAVEARRQDS